MHWVFLKGTIIVFMFAIIEFKIYCYFQFLNSKFYLYLLDIKFKSQIQFTHTS